MMPEIKRDTTHIWPHKPHYHSHILLQMLEIGPKLYPRCLVFIQVRHVFMNFVLGFMLISTMSAMLQVAYSVTAKIQVTVNVNFNMPYVWCNLCQSRRHHSSVRTGQAENPATHHF